MWPTTYRICHGRECDQPHWTVRYWTRLILTKCYSPDLPGSWMWPTTLDCEILNSPDTYQVLLTGFAVVVKVTNHTGLWGTELAWYLPSATHRICRGREGDQSHWTVRYWTRLILTKCYSPDLPWSWMWPITLDCEVLNSPDTYQVLLTGFAVVVKVTNHTGLWGTELAWYLPSATHRICRGRECDQPHWTVGYWTRLILTKCYSPDLPWSWRWPTTLDCKILNSPDTYQVLLTGFAGVVKVTNHTGQWDTELAWYLPSATHRICRGREGGQPHWTVRYWTRQILTKCYLPDLPGSWRWPTTLDSEILNSPDTYQVLLTRFAMVMKVPNHTGLGYTELAWYLPSATHRICHGHEGAKPHWTRIYWTRLILTKCYSPWLWRCQTTLDCEILSHYY